VSKQFLDTLPGPNHFTPDTTPHHVRLPNGELMLRAGTVTLYIKFQYMVMPLRASLLPTLQQFDIILGMPWLAEFQPTVNWVTGCMQLGWHKEELVHPVCKGQEVQGVWHVHFPLPVPATLQRDQVLQLCHVQPEPRHTLQLGPPPNPALEEAIKHLPADAQQLIRDFADVFDETRLQQLPPHRDIDHTIRLLPDQRPPFQQPYRMSQAELDTLREHLNAELASGRIRPSRSPYGAPVLYAYQPGKKPRLCYDYRRLNQQTVKHRYPLPRIEDMLDKFNSASVFTKLDLAAGFNQIRIAKEDVPKTAFFTRYGQFETLVMPFGVCNGPATFQQAMNGTLHDLLDTSAQAYLDDVAGYSPTHEQHLVDLRAILVRLRRDGWICRLAKCQFFVDTMLFAGHEVKGAQPHLHLPATRKANPDKVACVTGWGTPVDAKELQRFLGLVNYFAVYIKDFSTVAAPLHHIQRKDVPWVWGPEQEHAFKALKQALVSDPVLALPDPQ
jgi:Reverse transcriptase (RNA-dependent DNA polymerase)